MLLKLIHTRPLFFAVAWSIFILILCSTPGHYIPTTNWLELLSFDKLVHASIFFVLVILWLIVLIKYNLINTFSICITIALCITYGGVLEIMQAQLFSQRSGDWLDFIANSIGCIVALIWFVKSKGRNFT